MKYFEWIVKILVVWVVIGFVTAPFRSMVRTTQVQPTVQPAPYPTVVPTIAPTPTGGK